MPWRLIFKNSGRFVGEIEAVLTATLDNLALKTSRTGSRGSFVPARTGDVWKLRGMKRRGVYAEGITPVSDALEAGRNRDEARRDAVVDCDE